MTPTRLFRRRQRSRLREPGGGRDRPLHSLRHLGAASTYPFVVGSDLRDVAGDRRRPLTFGSQDADAIEAEVYSHLIPVKRRIWLQRTLLLLIRAAVLVVGLCAAYALLQLLRLEPSPALLQYGAGIVVLWTLVLVARQRVTYADAARVLDRRLDLAQTLGTAIELIHTGVDTRLARLQLRRATDLVRRVESGSAVPLRLPRRDLRTLAALAVVAVLFAYLATLNLSWPGSAVPSEEMAVDPAAELIDEAPIAPAVYEGDPSGMFDPQLLDGSLDSYLSDLEGQNLSPEEIQERIAELQASLAQRAEAANRQRQALNDMAEALSDSSATSDAAESIRRGEYERAASQLGELGKQSGQLSQRARADLARRLNEAAQRVAANNPELANKMRRAAQALAQNDQAAAEQALSELGEGVKQSGEQLQSLNDTSEPFDPSTLGEMSGAEGAGMSDLQSEALDGLSDYEGAGSGDEFGEGDMAGGEGLGDPSNDMQGSAAAGQRSDQLGIQPSTGAGGAGSGPGNEQTNPGARNAGQAPGRLLELRGRPSDSGSSQLDEGSKVPLVNSNDGSVSGAAGAAGRQAIVDPLSVRAEQNFVPWEKRQIIKDYFSGSAAAPPSGSR